MKVMIKMDRGVTEDRAAREAAKNERKTADLQMRYERAYKRLVDDEGQESADKIMAGARSRGGGVEEAIVCRRELKNHKEQWERLQKFYQPRPPSLTITVQQGDYTTLKDRGYRKGEKRFDLVSAESIREAVAEVDWVAELGVDVESPVPMQQLCAGLENFAKSLS